MFLGRAATLVAVGGTALLGVGSPAHAQPAVAFDDGCGFTDVEVTGVSNGETVDIERGTVGVTQPVVSLIETDDDGVVRARVGATSGILFRVFVGNESERVEVGHWGHGTPDSCTEPPLPFVSDDCQGNSVIDYSNFGPAPVTGVIVTEGAESPVTFPAGTHSTTAVHEEPFGSFELMLLVETELILHVAHTYESPAECEQAPPPVAHFTDDCDGLTVFVAEGNSFDTIGPELFVVERGPDAAGQNPVAVGFSGRGGHTVPAQPGDGFVVRLVGEPVGGPVMTVPSTGITPPPPTESSPLRVDEPVSHTYQPPASCDPGDGGDPGDQEGDPGDQAGDDDQRGAGGSLPITGIPAGLAGAAGVGLLLAGALLVLVLRRRRIRFEVVDR